MNVNAILLSVGVFLAVILLLVIVLLVAKKFLVPSGDVKVVINGDKEYHVPAGGTLLGAMGEAGVHLPSACGGKGSCGQCKCQVLEGGGEILPTETVHFTRKQQKEHWRLGCQVKVKGDMQLKMDESVLGVKEWECTVISNRNVATFIKEFKVALLFLLFAGEVNGLGREDLATTFEHLALTLTARTLTTTSRRQVYACFAHSAKQGTTSWHVVFFVAVDNDFHIA